MEFVGSLYRPTAVEPESRSAAVDASDSSARLKKGIGPLLYTSAAPAARMQIITRPLAGVPADTGARFSARERSRLILATLISLLFIVFLSFTTVVSNGPADLGISINGDGVVTWVVPSGVGYDQGVLPSDKVLKDSTVNGIRTVTVAKSGDPSHPFDVSTKKAVNLGGLQQWGLIILALIFIGVGGPVYVKARHRVAASAFYGFCLASAVCLVLSTITYLGHGWVVMLMFISIMLWACSFAFFFFKFPVRVGKTRRMHRLFVSTMFVGAVAAIGVYLWIFNYDPELYQIAQLVGLSYIALCVVLGLT